MSKLGIEVGSKAMWGSHCYHGPTRTLLDAGPGTIQHLGSRIFAIERIMITHQCVDHWSDLIPFVGLRAHTKGDTAKPLQVYYPIGCRRLDKAVAFIKDTAGRLSYDLTFHPIEPGFTLPLDRTHSIEAFTMQHRRDAPCLGYKVVETRSRLSDSCRMDIEGLHGPEVGRRLALWRTEGRRVDEVYRSTAFAYCLDSYTLDHEHLRDAALAVMDTTFLSADDRDDPTHATLREAVEACKAVGVKHVVAAHLSVRYHPTEVRSAVDSLSKELDIPITLCDTTTLLTL